jgi:hypothetical protein
LEEDRHLLLDAGRFLVERVLAIAETRQRQSRAAPSPEQRTARKVAEKVAVTKLAARVKATLVLDLPVTLIGGETKALRYMTKTELDQLGGFYVHLGARLEAPSEMCGERWTEGEVKALLGAAIQ